MSLTQNPMKIGIMTDIHEATMELARAIAVLRGHDVDRLVHLGDICSTHHAIEETVALLDEAAVEGVWGNHDFGRCRDNADEGTRARYSTRVLRYMSGLQPRLEVEGCLLTHVEPWLNAESIEDLWYFEGPPETSEQVARSFAAVSHRVIFVGHYHRWLLATLEGIQAWSAERPVVLEPANRYLVAVDAVCQGRCALYDTGSYVLTPVDLGQSD